MLVTFTACMQPAAGGNFHKSVIAGAAWNDSQSGEENQDFMQENALW